MKQRFLVEGMSCAACSASVEKAVNRLEFVNSASVNLLAKSMICDFEGGKEQEEAIMKAVSRAGFSATVWEEKQEKNEEKKTEETNEQSKKMVKRLVLSIIFCALLMYVAMGHMIHLPLTHFLSKPENSAFNGILQLILALPVLYLNRSYYEKGVKAFFLGHANMDSLVAMGSGASIFYSLFVLLRASLALGNGDMLLVSELSKSFYFDSGAMILTLVTVGKTMEERSKEKTGTALKKLTELSPKFAFVVRNGETLEIPPEELVVGDIFIVHPGERIPADGVIIDGASHIDESALTGESMPSEKAVGDKVLTACTNLDGFLTVRAEQVGKETTLSHIISLVEEAGASKAPAQKLADKVSGIFVPVVLTIAAVTFILWLIFGQTVSFSIARAVSVLVISCPCALGLATPVAMTVSMGKSASRGILIKNAETIELLHNVDTVIFDKTGTLTKGSPEVTDVFAFDEEALLKLAVSIEKPSEHPLAKAIIEYGKDIESDSIRNFKNIVGKGVTAEINEKSCFAGTPAFFSENGISCDEYMKKSEELRAQGKTVLFFGYSEKCLGIIAVSDAVRENSKETVSKLKEMGIKTVLLTGDHPLAANAIGKKVGIDEVISEVLPTDKEKVVRDYQEKGRKVLMVGDGINDSPALTRADIGCAMGGGTEIAIESADMVLLHDDPIEVPVQIAYSKRTMRIIKQNLFWAFFYNVLGIPVAAGALFVPFGIVLNPMIGAAAMSCSSLFVVSNALRLYRK